MQVSEDTFELGKAIGQLLRGDARGANALLGWPPDNLHNDSRESDLAATLTSCFGVSPQMLTWEVNMKPRSPHW